MNSYAVVGRFSRSIFGPFATVDEATKHIKVCLRSSERAYEVILWDESISAAQRRRVRHGGK
jgi:hypothetical protein